MANDDLSGQLREQGIVLLKNVFSKDDLIPLREAATRRFEAIGPEILLPDSHSVLLSALKDFGCSAEQLMAPLSVPVLIAPFSEAIGHGWTCNREQSWIRKKFAPGQSPSNRYHLQTWHQDGALGVRFPASPGPAIPMTELLTCWIPLNSCGVESPGLEFVRGPQPELLHFTELSDPDLRNRFGPDQFWAPELEFGDGLIFLNSVLHRTFVTPAMERNRLSVEYRIFPSNASQPFRKMGADAAFT